MKSTKPIIMAAHVRQTETGTSIHFTNNKAKMIIKLKPNLSDKKETFFTFLFDRLKPAQ